jgi:RNA polymerase sigma factor (sigma-70 family)
MRAFYERYYGFALSVCLAYANDREDAREILNDGFLKVFKHLQQLQDPDTLLPWLRRIMVNTGIDYYRKNQKRVSAISMDTVAYALEEPYLNDIGLFAQLSAEDIVRALQTLAAPYRMVFGLYVLEGYSHAEIAQKLAIAEGTSRAHLTEANKQMRQILTKMTSYDQRTQR